MSENNYKGDKFEGMNKTYYENGKTGGGME